MPKLIFINRYFYPDHSATSQLLSDLAWHASRSGKKVIVVTGRQVYDDPSRELSPDETVRQARILRVWTTRFGRQRLWGRAIDYGTFYVAALCCLLRIVRSGDVIVVKTDPPLISTVAAGTAKFHGAILINWIQDLFPEVAGALSVKGMGWAEGMLRWLRNRSLRAARWNVVIGDGMARRLADEGIRPDTIQVIHNWADGVSIQPVKRNRNELRQEWNLEDKFVVGYSGNFGRVHEFGTILKAAAELNETTRDIVFLFIGGGAQLNWMAREVEQKGLRNIMFKPYQPRDRLPLSLSVPDVHLISLRPSLEGLIVPSKFYGIAAAGRPTIYIGDQNGEVPKIMKRANCGWTVSMGDFQGLLSTILRLEENRVEADEAGYRARDLFNLEFDKQHAWRRWDDILHDEADGSRAHPN